MYGRWGLVSHATYLTCLRTFVCLSLLSLTFSYVFLRFPTFTSVYLRLSYVYTTSTLPLHYVYLNLPTSSTPDVYPGQVWFSEA